MEIDLAEKVENLRRQAEYLLQQKEQEIARIEAEQRAIAVYLEELREESRIQRERMAMGIDPGREGGDRTVVYQSGGDTDRPFSYGSLSSGHWISADFGHGRSIKLEPHKSQYGNLNACTGCRNYCGKTYSANLLVCGIHAYGWDGDECPDWEDEEGFEFYGRLG